MANVVVPSEVAERLLNLPTFAEQVEMLRAIDLLNEHGLMLLLDEVEELADVEPARASQLSIFCEEAAGVASAPASAPRAQYLRAQTHAIHGEFDLALDLIHQAWSGYSSLSMKLEALRTQVGFMNVLDELGRYP